MKAKNIFIALAITVFIFASCSNDNDATDDWNGEINLSTKAQPLLRANSTDVPDKQIADGQSVGVFITEEGTGELIATNAAYEADGQGALSSNITHFYPQTGNNVLIKGYHPHNIAAGDSYAFAVATDQSVDTDYFDSDLLYCTEFSKPRTKAAASMSFDHKLAKVTYTLTPGSGMEATDLEGAVVKILQLLPETTFDRNAGTITAAAGTLTDITLHSTYGAVIVPQGVAFNTRLLQVTLASGGTLYANVEDTGGVIFESGKHYIYTVTVNLTSVSMATTVKPWTPVNKTVTAEME